MLGGCRCRTPLCQLTLHQAFLLLVALDKSDSGGFVSSLVLLTINDLCFRIMRALFES
jgi:hypothetical protein